MLPQILPDSPLGQRLTALASEANTIVEVGTGCGLGSTLCLWNGLRKPSDSMLFSIEADKATFEKAKNNLSNDWQMALLYGRLHSTIRPYFHPVDSIQDRETYEAEATNTAPYITELPKAIDLLFLDGGEFTSDGDFLRLWQRSKVIVLDDCNREKAVKNVYAFECLRSAKWPNEIYLNDRNGWGIFWRP